MASAAHTPASSGTTAALGDVQVAFSEGGDYLAILYSLGESIVNVYSTNNAATVVTKFDSQSIREQEDDLSSNGQMNGISNASTEYLQARSTIGSFCSLIWENVSRRGGRSRRRRGSSKLSVSSTSEELSSISAIAVGTNSGRFFVWEAMNGSEVRWKRQVNEDGSACQPVSYNSKIDSYFVGGSGTIVHQLHAISGQVLQSISCSVTGNKRLSALAISPSGEQVGVASSRIGIYSIESSDQICKLAGHQNGTREIRFLGSNNFAISIGNRERTIAIWRIESKPRKQLSSHRTIALDYPVESVASNDNDIIAICDNSQAFHFKLSNDGELLQEPVPVASNDKVLTAVISSGIAILATGAASNPGFERFPLDETDQLSAQDGANGLVPKDEKKTTRRQRKTAKDPAQASVVGPNEIAGNILPTAATKRQIKDANKAEQLQEDESAEQTIGEKLNEMRVDVPQKNEAEDSQSPTADNATASSLAVLLSQALQADDRDLLEKCLNVTDAKTVHLSVRQLRTPQVIKFLKHSIARLKSSPARAVQLSVWNKEVLSQHTGSLMANPTSQQLLADLRQVIDSRGKLFAPLLSLGGRLELLKSQINRRASIDVDSTDQESFGKTLTIVADEENIESTNAVSSDSDEESDEADAMDLENEFKEGEEHIGVGNGSIDADMEFVDGID